MSPLSDNAWKFFSRFICDDKKARQAAEKVWGRVWILSREAKMKWNLFSLVSQDKHNKHKDEDKKVLRIKNNEIESSWWWGSSDGDGNIMGKREMRKTKAELAWFISSLIRFAKRFFLHYTTHRSTRSVSALISDQTFLSIAVSCALVISRKKFPRLKWSSNKVSALEMSLQSAFFPQCVSSYDKFSSTAFRLSSFLIIHELNWYRCNISSASSMHDDASKRKFYPFEALSLGASGGKFIAWQMLHHQSSGSWRNSECYCKQSFFSPPSGLNPSSPPSSHSLSFETNKYFHWYEYNFMYFFPKLFKSWVGSETFARVDFGNLIFIPRSFNSTRWLSTSLLKLLNIVPSGASHNVT